MAALPAAERRRALKALVTYARDKRDEVGLPAPRGFHVSVLEKTQDRGTQGDIHRSHEFSLNRLSRNTRHLILASAAGNVAYLSYDYKFVEGFPTLTIYQLFAAPNLSAQGLREYLMSCAKWLAVAAGMHHVIVQCMTWHESERKFYVDELGFKVASWSPKPESNATYEVLLLSVQ